MHTNEYQSGQELNDASGLAQVLRGCYRLIKAMTTDCSKTQLEFSAHVPKFLEQTHAHLVSHDVSPSECISAVFKNNLTNWYPQPGSPQPGRSPLCRLSSRRL